MIEPAAPIDPPNHFIYPFANRVSREDVKRSLNALAFDD
jgi:hypothetical protein